MSFLINCKFCKKEINASEKSVKYCNTICYNRDTKAKPISGYKACLSCNKPFPFRISSKVRGSRSRDYGMIGGLCTKYCSKKCSLLHRNKYFNPASTKEGREKISKAKLGKSTHNKGKKIPKEKRVFGEKHWNWQGGITPENISRRNLVEYKEWRFAIFSRDNFTCQLCSARSGKGTGKVELQADHIKPWAKFPELRLELSNGRTLCVPCHRKTDTYGGRLNKQPS